MFNNLPSVPSPKNEPVYSYTPGTPEKKALKEQIELFLREQVEVPIIIGGEEIKSGDLSNCIMPHNHKHLLGKYHKGNAEHVGMAIAAAANAKKDWENMPWDQRASIFLKAADLLACEFRQVLNAATMLGQSKTVHQAEVDAACELIDFFKFNVAFMNKLYGDQPLSSPGIWNRVEYRPMEGFIFAVTPFNFTSIAANLPTAPAMMGNTVVWKPASTSVYSAYFIMQLLKRAGLPDGVINLVPGSGATIGDPAMNHPDLAGVHFTGSTSVFQNMWKIIGKNIEKYKTYPRIVGETGGKDFVVAHSSANLKELTAALVRGAFEYQGQKCSAASRAYIPDNLWADLKKSLTEEVAKIKVGDVSDFTNFMGAVIDKASFNKIKSYIDYAKDAKDAKIIIGGECDDSAGYFVKPTVIVTTDPKFKTMQEEIFGPVLTIYVYPENKFSETLELCNETSIYGLTGAIFAEEKAAVIEAMNVLRHAAGNFYINDKPTGAVVGHQPFGGSRASGTNDKAGSIQNLMRWTSVRTIKEVLCPATDFRYPFMQEE